MKGFFQVISRSTLVTSATSTVAASISDVHQKLTWHMFMYYCISDTFSNLDKLNHGKYSKYQLCLSRIDMFISYHLKKNRLKWFQGDTDTLRYPATLISSTMVVTVVSTRYIHQNFTWHMLIIYHFTKTNRCKRSQCPTEWSKCSCTTLSNSTMASTANQ